MTDRDAFLRTIIENPDDDTPRLVFADWLEENGDPERAEFIRLQIELMRTLEWEPRFDEIQFRVGDLLSKNGMRWRPELPWFDRLIYERGFVEGVIAVADDFFENRNALRHAIPLREVRFTASDSTIYEILDAVNSERLPRVSFDLPNGLMGLWQTPPRAVYPHLLCLSLREIGLDDGNANRVFAPQSLPGLLRLDVSFNRLRRGVVTTIARACPRLTELRASATEQTDYADRLRAGGAHEIAHSWPYGTLRFIGLAHQQIGDAGLRALAESPYLSGVEVLDLAANDIGTIGTTAIETLAGSLFLRQVRWLNLRGNPIGNAGLRELILWPTLKELRKLDLSYCNITSAGARLLADQELHPDLRLDLTGNPIDSNCLDAPVLKRACRLRH